MSVTGQVAYGYSGSQYTNIGSIVNSVSRRILGQDASNDGIRPTKTELIEICNDKYQSINNLHSDWMFLNRSTTVNGYELSTTSSDYASYTGTPALGTDIGATRWVSATDLYIKPITITAEKVWNVSSMVLPMGRASGSFGVPDGTVTAYISTTQAVSGAVSTSTALSLDSLGIPTSANTDVTFTFPNTYALEQTSTYYVIVEVVYTALTGDYVYVGQVSNANGNTSVNLNGAGVTTATGYDMSFDLTYYEGSYLTELTLDSSIKYIYRIYKTDVITLTKDLNPRNSSDLPEGRFWKERKNDDGTWTITIDDGVLFIKTWTIEYKVIPSYLSADADTPILPREYRYLIKLAAELECLSLGYGISSPDRIELILVDYNKGINRLEKEYRPEDLVIGVDINQQNYTPETGYSNNGYNGYNNKGAYPTKPINRRF